MEPMATTDDRDRDSPSSRGDRCYSCFRPQGECFCASIPVIENQTEVLILQHRRERFHPFNTARIAQKALQNSSLLVDHTARLGARLQLKPRAGLLYPGRGVPLISDVPVEQRPEQLVVIDGTWHQAKTLVRDIRELHGLPRYQLAPVSPSRYRLRREPNATSLSTIEAIVAALRVLEPDTAGLDQLLALFDYVVERQLNHPRAADGWRRNHSHKGTSWNIPSAFMDDLDDIVVAYGESAAGGPGRGRVPRCPIFWVAQRLGSGERFACAIEPPFPLQEWFLGHLELTPADFSQAVSLDEFRTAWTAFRRPNDTLVVYSQSTAHLLANAGAAHGPCLVLKSIDFNPQRRYGTLDEVLAAEGLTSGPARHPGRAGQRLAKALALVRHLNLLGRAAGARHGG